MGAALEKTKQKQKELVQRLEMFEAQQRVQEAGAGVGRGKEYKEGPLVWDLTNHSKESGLFGVRWEVEFSGEE